MFEDQLTAKGQMQTLGNQKLSFYNRPNYGHFSLFPSMTAMGAKSGQYQFIVRLCLVTELGEEQ